MRSPQIRAALFDPPPFNPEKLTLRYLPGASGGATALPQMAQRYTLTHNDLTGRLTLTIGPDYNREQLEGWYTRILRDEVLAEWQPPPPGALAAPSLHVYCHVSGEEGWPAPPSLRSFIFQREMTLVLDSIAYAERALLEADPALAAAPVVVHLISDMAALNRTVQWGQLGDRSTWQKAQGGGVLRSLLAGLFPGLAGDAPLVGEAAPVAARGPAASTSPRVGGQGGEAAGNSGTSGAAGRARRGAAPSVRVLPPRRVSARPWSADGSAVDGLPGLPAVQATLPPPRNKAVKQVK